MKLCALRHVLPYFGGRIAETTTRAAIARISPVMATNVVAHFFCRIRFDTPRRIEHVGAAIDEQMVERSGAPILDRIIRARRSHGPILPRARAAPTFANACSETPCLASGVSMTVIPARKTKSEALPKLSDLIERIIEAEVKIANSVPLRFRQPDRQWDLQSTG